MKHILLSITLFLLFLPVFSQTIEVVNFRHEPTDLRARRPGVKDINDQNCALLIVAAWHNELTFTDNSVSKVERIKGEYWVWFSPNARRVTISAQGYTTRYFDFPNPLKGEEVYAMTLKMDRLDDPKITEVVSITFNINQPDVVVAKDNQAGVQATGNTARYSVVPGVYQFKFTKQGFTDFSKEFTVKSDTTIAVTMVAGTSTYTFKPPSIITVNSNPPGATVYANQQMVGQTPLQKMLEPGSYTISLTKELFQDHATSISLESGVPLDLGTIEMKSISAEVNVTSNPTGADFYLNNRFLGKAPFKKEVTSGSYTLEARLADYRTWTQDIVLEKGDKMNYNATLTPAFGELVIESTPVSGMSIFINGKKESVTPFRKSRVPSGSYEVEVRDEVNLYKGVPLWLGSKETVTVNDGKKTERTLTMLQNYGEVSLKAVDAEIFINSERLSAKPIDIKLPPGTYTFTGKRSKHHDDSKTVSVTVAGKQVVELSPKPMLGSVSIITNPFESRGATIEVNGSAIKDKTPTVVPLLIGTYNISVSHPKYLPQQQSVVIQKEGDVQEVKFELISYEGSYAQKVKKWKASKFVSLAAAAVLGSAGGYLYLKADDTYAQYQKATSTAEADALRKDVGKYELLSNVSFGISVVPVYMFFHSLAKQKKYQKLSKKN